MEKISKLNVAKRQLDTAINLYFRDVDAISIHTITAAAHQILVDLSKLKGIESILKGPSAIKRSEMKGYLSNVNKEINFFKHADKDPHSLLKFNSEITDFFIFDSIQMYKKLTRETPKYFLIFETWFLAKNIDIVSKEALNDLAKKDIDIKLLSQTPKIKIYRILETAIFPKTWDETFNKVGKEEGEFLDKFKKVLKKIRRRKIKSASKSPACQRAGRHSY